MARYKKKPVEIEAIQLTWRNWSDICDFITLDWEKNGIHGKYLDNGKIGLVIPTLEGDHLAEENDYIIKGVQGEFYPCKPHIFHKTYEKVTGKGE